MTMLAGAVSALFGILVAQQRAREKELKEEIKDLKDEKKELETRLLARDDVVEKNTASMLKVAESQSQLVSMLQDVIHRVNQIEDRHGSTSHRSRGGE